MADEELQARHATKRAASRRELRRLATIQPQTIPIQELGRTRAQKLALLAAYERLYGTGLRRMLPERAASVLETIDVLHPFAVGFFLAARLPPRLARADPDLEGPAEQLAFLLGLLWGNGKGVAAAIADNVVGLYDLARLLHRYATPLGHVQMAIEDVFSRVTDPLEHERRQREQALRLIATLEALKDFVRAMESDSDFLRRSAFEMGQALGEDATRWASGALVAKPFERGEYLGQIYGRIVTEIVLCVVPMEQLIAPALRASAVAIQGSRIARRLRPILERMPGFRRLFALRRELEATRATGRSAAAIDDAARGVRELDSPAPVRPRPEPLPSNVHRIEDARGRSGPQLTRQSPEVSRLEERMPRRRVQQAEVQEQRLASGDRQGIVAARSVDDETTRPLHLVTPEDPAGAARATAHSRQEARMARGVAPAARAGAAAERAALLSAVRAADREGRRWPDGALRLDAVVESFIGKLTRSRAIPELEHLEKVIPGHVGRSTFGKDFWGFVRAAEGERGPVSIEVKWKPGDLDVNLHQLRRAGDIQGSAAADAADWLEWLAHNRRRVRKLVADGLLDAHWLDREWVSRNGAQYFLGMRRRFMVVVSPSGTAGVSQEALREISLAARRVVRRAEPPDLAHEVERIARELAERRQQH